MSQQAEELLTRNLLETPDRLHEDLDRVELWTAALSCFLHPPLEYQPGEQYKLPAKDKSAPPRADL
jgi:hypothetical protein